MKYDFLNFSLNEINIPVVFFLFLGVIVIRVIPRLILPYDIATDTWYHFSSANSIKKNNHNIPSCNDGYILGGKYDYPYLFHWVLSFLSKEQMISWDKYISAILDSVYIGIAFFYVLFLNYIDVLVWSSSTYSLFLLLLMFSTTMLKTINGPRVYNTTPRIFGEILIFISFIFLHLFFYYQNYNYMFLSAFFMGLGLNSSTFGSQVLLFFTIFLSVFFQDVTPILTFFVGIFFALTISKGHYYYILKQQLKYSYQYATFGQFNHSSAVGKNSWANFTKLIHLLKEKKFKKALSIFYSRLTIVSFFLRAPEALLAIFSIIFFNSILVESPIIIYIIITSWIMFFFTSFKPFLFLGESDRYFDYIIIFATIVICSSFNELYIYIAIVFMLIFNILSLHNFFYKEHMYAKELMDAAFFIKKNYNNKNYKVHGIWGSLINYPLSFLTDLDSLAIETNYVWDLVQNNNIYDSLNSRYKNDFDYLYEKYNINVILVRKAVIIKEEDYYNFDKYENKYENKMFIVFLRK